MDFSRLIISFIVLLMCTSTWADTPTVDAPLPLLAITERGELTMTNDEFSFIPWSSDTEVGKVQVIQYFGATMTDKDTFEPFTDLLQTSFEPGVVHVTTVLNLDAALWGTTGLVISELKKNKRLVPEATMILDDNGIGIIDWGLGDAGTGLIIVDEAGTVKYFSREALSEVDMATALDLIRANIKS